MFLLDWNQKHMSAQDVVELCMHVERVIERGHRFEILNQNFPHTMHDLVSDINIVCMYLMDFDNPLVEL